MHISFTARRWLLRTLCLWPAGLLACCRLSSAADVVTWLEVTPDHPIHHGVSIRGPFDGSRESLKLIGPAAIVTAAVKADDSLFLTAYSIATPAPSEPQTVGVGGAGDEPLVDVTVGQREYLLLPAQRLTDGQPQPIAEPTVFEARALLNARVPESVTAIARAAANNQTLGPASHLCLPAEYFHHFERTTVREAGRGLLLFSVAGDSSSAAVSSIDDFGTSRLIPGKITRIGVWVRVETPATRP